MISLNKLTFIRNFLAYTFLVAFFLWFALVTYFISERPVTPNRDEGYLFPIKSHMDVVFVTDIESRLLCFFLILWISSFFFCLVMQIYFKSLNKKVADS